MDQEIKELLFLMLAAVRGCRELLEDILEVVEDI